MFGIGGPVAAALAILLYFFRKGIGQDVIDPRALSMIEEVRKDIVRVEALVRHAIGHAEQSHKEMGSEINGLKTCLAVVKNEVTHLKNGKT